MQNLIKIENLRYAIPYGKEIFNDVNFYINEGEIIGILGVNGAGKTTLIDIILGQRNNFSGSVLVLNEKPFDLNRKNNEKIFFISQDITLPGKFTIKEFCDLNKILYSTYNNELEQKLINLFDLELDTKIGSLSTGQQRKVQIICAIASMPKLIIVDEITAVLDPETRAKFYYILKEVQKRFKTSTIIATNIASDLTECAQRIYFIKQNQVQEHETTEIQRLFNLE